MLRNERHMTTVSKAEPTKPNQNESYFVTHETDPARPAVSALINDALRRRHFERMQDARTQRLGLVRAVPR